jgi:phosphoglycolate phosphatase-like HAD superfamily hydrolase
MTLQAVLWDFGDTLADERWMLAPLDGAPGWPEAYRRVLDGGDLADRWNVGSIAAADVAEEFGRALSVPGHRVLRHMRACCRKVSLCLDVMALTAALAPPQAIVTINPDIFSEVVVPHYALRERFAAIVTSWEERTLSKADLCEAAMSRLPGAVDREACLLIDNRADNVAEWRARGGAAWLFEGYRSLTEHLSDQMEAR